MRIWNNTRSIGCKSTVIAPGSLSYKHEYGVLIISKLAFYVVLLTIYAITKCDFDGAVTI